MPHAYERPESLNEALDILSGGGWTVLSGGTDIFPLVTEAQAWGRSGPERILDISAVGALTGIETSEKETRIGARATWTDVIEADLPCYFSALKAAGREVGGMQIQNRGTIAGNICNASPAADGVPALLALEAELEIAGRNSIRRLAIPEFILGNRRTALGEGELVTAICIQKRSPAARSSFQKLGARRYLVISIAMVAIVLDVDDSGKINHARVAVGSCSEVAQRLPTLEAALIGGLINDELGMFITSDALSPLSPIGDIRADANYRMTAAHNLIRRALADLGDSQ